MKVVAGIATFGNRKEYLHETVRSLGPQTDEIWIYDNNHRIDLTDLGKFIGLEKKREEPIYYFSCDDDLIYPEDYIQKSIEAIELYQCIVTYHGRKLRGKNLNYYKEHYGYAFNKDLSRDILIDVAGTGVAGFRTDYFNPVELLESPYRKMSDVIFSLEAAKKRKRIMVLAHHKDWIVQQNVPVEETIMHNEKDRCEVQGELANQIFDLNGHITSLSL